MSQLLEHLNAEQLAAVTLPPRHALILAGAGSGKTRVLTTRIAWLIQNGHCSPQGILAVTFTNKAAKEMLTRLSALLPINTRGMWIGTFHGLCNRFLRAHHRDAGLPQLFQILDSGDQLAAVKRLLKTLNVDDEKFPPRDLQHFINGQKEAGIRPPAVEAWDDFTRRKVELYAEYEAQCQRESVVDFPELLLRCYEVLERNEPLRRHYQARFRHILVDEFQDTNRLQYRWLSLLADGGREGGARVFCVGDDDQSIYRFRGAEIGNMRDFERAFHVTDVIRLEQNYRSHGNILDAANALIAHNRERLGKHLWTDRGAGEPIRVYEAFTDTDEARWIVEEIQSLVRDGVSRSSVALLYRSNAQSRVLEHQLFSSGVAYRVYGGLRFFERQEIKHALAYLRLLANPDDDTAFLRVANVPRRDIGATTLEKLGELAQSRHATLLQAAGSDGVLKQLAPRSASALAGFVDLLRELAGSARRLSAAELVDEVIRRTRYAEHLAAEVKDQSARNRRLENLKELADWFRAMGKDGGSVGDLAAQLALLTHADRGDPGNAVRLMTLHAAKGLEFRFVYVVGLEDGQLPHEGSIEEGRLEEERRLMYVGITRAKERLCLSYAARSRRFGEVQVNAPSRFLAELPAEDLHWDGRDAAQDAEAKKDLASSHLARLASLLAD